MIFHNNLFCTFDQSISYPSFVTVYALQNHFAGVSAFQLNLNRHKRNSSELINESLIFSSWSYLNHLTTLFFYASQEENGMQGLYLAKLKLKNQNSKKKKKKIHQSRSIPSKNNSSESWYLPKITINKVSTYQK